MMILRNILLRKVIFIGLLCLMVQSAAAQSRLITLSENDATIEAVINRIEDHSEYRFLYNTKVVDVTQKVSVTAKSESISVVLDHLLSNTDIVWTQTGNQIILNRKSVIPVPEQQKTLTGLVLDELDMPVIGASVIIKGTANGVATDADGKFTLLNVPDGSVLQVSYVGYRTQEIKTEQGMFNNSIPLVVRMLENTESLEEVVVIGYGTRRKRDLVGAVSQVDSKLLNERAQMNIAQSLQGQIPGLYATTSDGKPTRGATLSLRGTTSIGSGGGALILIDGVEGDINLVNPQDVESISVLKDASSSAIYGARGVFGVILVTTKNARDNEAPKVTYNGNYSVHSRMINPDIVTNGLQWAEGYFAAYAAGRGGVPSSFDDVITFPNGVMAWLEELRRRNADSSLEKVILNEQNGRWEYYGNTDWYNLIYKNRIYSHEHNVSIQGGGERAKYYISGRYFYQDGIYKVGDEKFDMYNLMAKGQLKVSDKITIDNKTSMAFRNSHQPTVYTGDQLIARQAARKMFPITVPWNPDGTPTNAAAYGGYTGFARKNSYWDDDAIHVANTTALTYKPTKELTFRGDFSFRLDENTNNRVAPSYDAYDGPTIILVKGATTKLTTGWTRAKYQSSNVTGNYTPKLGESHKLNVLMGGNLEHYYVKSVSTSRTGIVYEEKPSFALMDGEVYTIGQSGSEWSYLGLLYRVSYNYKDRYLAELSGRYDGSSKFPENSRWGFFPSLSLAWRISEEPFMKSTSHWLSNLKLRLSEGSLGNGNVSPFSYMSNIGIAKSIIIIGDGYKSYTSVPGNIPASLTWEKSTTYDVGLDVDLFDNRLNFIFDYYHRYTTDMFTPGMEVPAVFGAGVPSGNNAELVTKGWEVSMEYKNHFNLASKPFYYSFKAVVWDNSSWITKYNNERKLISNYYDGYKIGQIWGYHVDGLFRDQVDIDSHADQSAIKVADADFLRPGDIKFADLNDDKLINTGANTVDDPGDQKIIGNTSPRYMYGVTLSGNWHGIGISVFVQGVGRQHWYPHRESPLFWGQYDRPYEHMLRMHTGDNIFTDENQNFDAYWPRYRAYLANNSSRSLGVQNDRYLQNIAYVRLKNLSVNYTFNQKVSKWLHASQLRVYFTGDNLWTWSPLFKVTRNFDPQSTGAGDGDFGHATANSDQDGTGYPMMSSYTIGINVTF
jgi:TonB-linked SusC/RagA family outer membrane protein